MSSGKYTFLPEIYDIFGREGTIKFLELFAGCTVAVPPIETLQKLARNASVYIRLESSPPAQRAAIIRTIAEEYDLVEDRVRRVYEETKSLFEDTLGFKILCRRRG